MDASDEVKGLLRSTEETALARLGPSNPKTLSLSEQLAKLIHDRGRPAEVVPLPESIVARLRLRTGPDHRQTATFRMLQANALTRLSRFSESETFYLSAHECLLRTLGESHPNTKKARRLLFELYTAWRKPDTAARWSDGSR